MLPRERVEHVLRHKRPDKIPISGWLRLNKELREAIINRHGSVEAFEDQYQFDLAPLISPELKAYPQNVVEKIFLPLKHSKSESLDIDLLMDIPFSDPNDMSMYQDVKDWISHHKEQLGRSVMVRQSGFFEYFCGILGVENHMVCLLTKSRKLSKLYERLAQWISTVARNCLDLGIDIFMITDDWGAQNGLLFSPDIWWELMFPPHKHIVDNIKKCGGRAALHSDGNIEAILNGITEIGYDMLHPFQESTGMSLNRFKETFSHKLTMFGGLDVQTTLGFGRLDFLKEEIERVLGFFKDGGLILWTSHAVQDHCSIDELEYAYELINEKR